MSVTLKAKGKKPSGNWGFEFSLEHFYKLGEGPPIQLQNQAHELTSEHLSKLIGLLQVLGYDPASLKFSIEYSHANP